MDMSTVRALSASIIVGMEKPFSSGLERLT